jgi:cytoskeletal protein CcmA (bactofilin family)
MSIRTTNSGLLDDPSSRTDDQVFSLVDRHSAVEGKLLSSRDLRIDGNVSGEVLCDGVLYVAAGSTVNATVSAGSIVVAGTLSGTIQCKGRLEIQASGIVRGEVETATLVIVEGAVYEGAIRMDATRPPDIAFAEPDAPSITAEEPEQTGYSFLRRFSAQGADERSGDGDLPTAREDDESNP